MTTQNTNNDANEQNETVAGNQNAVQKLRTTIRLGKVEPTFPVREMDAEKGWRYHWFPILPPGGVEIQITNIQAQRALEAKIASAAQIIVMQVLGDGVGADPLWRL